MDEAEFRSKLTPEQYRILREKDTERPYSGKYWDNDEPGLYTCAACGQTLFLSLSKFDAGNGWPTFKKPAHTKVVEFVEADGTTEVACRKCGSHIGYRENETLRANSGALEFLALPELELPDMESKEESETPKSQATHMMTFTLGGLAFGVAAGASVVFLSPPVPACVPEVVEKKVEIPVVRTVTTTISPVIIQEATTTDAASDETSTSTKSENADGTL